jgi:hypothetical protein
MHLSFQRREASMHIVDALDAASPRLARRVPLHASEPCCGPTNAAFGMTRPTAA